MTDQTAPTFVHGPRDDAKSLRWLALATTTDPSRPTLSGIYVDGDLTMATDGSRLHVAPTPETVAPLDGQIVRAKWPATPGKGAAYVADVEIVDSTWPNSQRIIDDARANEVGATVRLNAKYMKDFLDGLGDGDRIDLTIPANAGAPVILATTTNAKTPKRWALIMPVQRGNFAPAVNKAPAYDPWADDD